MQKDHNFGPNSLQQERVPDRFFNSFTTSASNFEQGRIGEKKDFSRHVSAVVSHFTSTKDGFNRLLAEIDDFVHVVTLDGLIKYSSPSVTKFLDYTQEEIVGKSIMDVVADPSTVSKYLQGCVSAMSEFLMYVRYCDKNGNLKLFEVRGMPFLSEVNSETLVVLAARYYSCKSSQSLDSVVELQIETLQLKARLESILEAKGLNPSKHPLLNDLETGGEDYTESFLYTMNDKNNGGFDTNFDLNVIPPSNLDQPQVTASPVAYIYPPPVAETSKEKKASKRKRVVPSDLFCLQCGTTKSPEWRNGPEGPKTLCNACGLAFYKKNRKEKKQREELEARVEK